MGHKQNIMQVNSPRRSTVHRGIINVLYVCKITLQIALSLKSSDTFRVCASEGLNCMFEIRVMKAHNNKPLV